MDIKLKKLSEEEFDRKYYEKIGGHSDDAYEIILDEHREIGLIMIENCNPHYGNECTFIYWVELFKPYRGKCIFSYVMESLFALYATDEIHFECQDEKLPMYTHMGAVVTGISELTENNMLILQKEDFNNRTKTL